MVAIAMVACAQAQAATVQVVANGKISSGVCLHRSAKHGTYFLCSKHGAGSPWEVRVGGRTWRGNRWVICTKLDLAMLIYEGSDIPVGVVRIGSPAGGRVQSVGYVADGRMMARTASYYETPGAIIASCVAEPGESGSGLYEGGKLIGICSARYPVNTVYVGPEAVASFLEGARRVGQAPWLGGK